MTKHTKGPWSYKFGRVRVPPHPHPQDKVMGVETAPVAPTLAHVSCLTGPEQQDADGHLISAAPDLLKALENLCDSCDLHAPDLNPFRAPQYPEMEVGRAAIAKAKGESSE